MKKTVLLLALSAVYSWAAAGNLVVSVLGKDGKPVQDAVVVVIPTNRSALPKTALPLQASVNQEKMQFIPAVSLVAVGAKVAFSNSDPWDHHVRSSPAGLGQFNTSAAGFELRLEGKTDGKPARVSEVTLDKSGAQSATLLGCHIHGSMRGYLYASESPWAAKTSAEGLVIFEDLPPGTAQVKVWQADQLIDLAPQQATIGGAVANQLFQLTVTPRRRRL